MSQVPAIDVERNRFEVACDWFVQLREHPESAEVISGWLEWLDADTRNQEAFAHARQVWQLTATASEAASPAGAGLPRRRLPLAAAAVLIGLIAGLTFWTLHVPNTLSYATARGETRRVDLPDGSHLVLAGDSQIAVRLSTARRDIDLLKGEAYFQVAHDKARPFVVHAASLHVTAVGTAFNVRTGSDRISVAVEEGVVVVDPRTTGDEAASGAGSDDAVPGATDGTQRISVRRGQEVTVALHESRVNLAPIEPQSVASWRAGRLRFSHEPLSAVLQSVRASSGVDIRLVDAAAGNLLFTGTVFNDHVPEWAAGLPMVFPLTVRHEGASILVEQKK
jgi:transmembrane sensor